MNTKVLVNAKGRVLKIGDRFKDDGERWEITAINPDKNLIEAASLEASCESVSEGEPTNWGLRFVYRNPKMLKLPPDSHFIAQRKGAYDFYWPSYDHPDLFEETPLNLLNKQADELRTLYEKEIAPRLSNPTMGPIIVEGSDWAPPSLKVTILTDTPYSRAKRLFSEVLLP